MKLTPAEIRENLSHARARAGISAHRGTTSPAESYREGQNEPRGAVSVQQWRMQAVTVALAEPAGSTPVQWAETVASILRLAFEGSTVEVIDTWEVTK